MLTHPTLNKLQALIHWYGRRTGRADEDARYRGTGL